MSIKIGITGGIGSGKSIVSQLLRVMEIPVYDSDSQAKQLTRQDPFIRRELTELLGDTLYGGGQLDKSILSSYLFSSSENAVRVNRIIHPRVKEHFSAWAAKHDSCALIALESAILVESGFTDCVDKIVLVTAPLDLRIRRTIARDHSSEELVMKRISAQMNDEERETYADYVLVNGCDTPLIPQLLQLIDQLKASLLS